MGSSFYFVLFVVLIAYVFDFINGFHDAANSIATIVTTGVLSPRQAVLWAAFFNLIAFMVFSLMVAKTIGNGLIDSAIVDAELIFSALMGAIIWNLITWYYGLPSSSSHALIGGLAGSALTKSGFSALIPSGFIKVGLGILLYPTIGIGIGFVLAFLFRLLLKKYSEKVLNKAFTFFQLVSSAFLSLTHGGNDAQKTMGIIAILLFSSDLLGNTFYVPFWVVLSCQFVISLGTLFGGWRIVNTMGTQITELNRMKACAAESAAAVMIFAATECGIPVSTTHTVTGAIAGVGLAKARWHTLKKIFFSWLLTIPLAGLLAAFFMRIFLFADYY